jgi:uncharacterized membrane protein YphA (DoxX/SURF4 family)
MAKIQKMCAFLARLFIGAFFIISAIIKIINWDGAQAKFLNVINDWNMFLSKFESLQITLNFLTPWITAIIITIVACELIGGLLLILGIRVRLGAFLIILFFLPTTILFHAFWLSSGIDRSMEITTFIQNIAIMGGTLHVLACGSK